MRRNVGIRAGCAAVAAAAAMIALVLVAAVASGANTAAAKKPKPLTAAETGWVTSSKIRSTLGKIDSDAKKLLRTGTIELDISSFSGSGPGHACQGSLAHVRKPPTDRLAGVLWLARKACTQMTLAANNSLGYSVIDNKTEKQTVHNADPAAAAKAAKQARAFVARATSLLGS